MATSTEFSGVPSECFVHPESDDEESFVVLCRSLPPDSLVQDSASEAVDVESIQTSVIQDSLKLTASALSQLSTSSSSLPPIPKVNEQELVINLQEHAPNTTTPSSSVDLSPDEIQQKLDVLIEENMKLKETLHQNNLAMKRQYETLVLWQEDVMKVHQSHKEKFAETKKFIENLKQENARLVESLKLAQAVQAQLKEELQALKTEKEEVELVKEKPDFSFMKTSLDNLKEFELETAKKKISNLEQQVVTLQKENNEMGQNSAAQATLAVQVQLLEKELAAAKQFNTQMTAESSKQVQQSEALQKILLEEIKGLKEQLKEKNKTVITKETHDNVQEQLMAAQMHITKLELLRNEDKDAINAKEEQIYKLENLVKEMTESMDTIAALRAQLELYKSDFEAERQAKEALRAEKEQIADDLRHLQRRNQQLLEEVERLRVGDFVHVSRPESPRSSSSIASAPQEDSGAKFTCPKCNFKFYNYQALENHVYRCIDIENLF